MKKDITYVARERFEQVIAEKGLSFTEQSGFLRVDGSTGHRLYVAATKRVGRVDLSGFEVELGTLAKKPHCGEFGRVKQQLAMHGTEDEVVARFAEVVDRMLALPAEVKPPKPAKAPKAPKAAQAQTAGDVPPAPASSPDDIKARLDLIKKVAAEHGVPVSSSTLALASE